MTIRVSNNRITIRESPAYPDFFRIWHWLAEDLGILFSWDDLEALEAAIQAMRQERCGDSDTRSNTVSVTPPSVTVVDLTSDDPDRRHELPESGAGRQNVREWRSN